MLSPELKHRLLNFRAQRDWEKFHKPKELVISLLIEATELLQLFQWKTDAEVNAMLEAADRERIHDEVADVAVYLEYLCHDLNIDLEDAVAKKLLKNEAKYPVEKVKGKAKKYSEY